MAGLGIFDFPVQPWDIDIVVAAVVILNSVNSQAARALNFSHAAAFDLCLESRSAAGALKVAIHRIPRLSVFRTPLLGQEQSQHRASSLVPQRLNRIEP